MKIVRFSRGESFFVFGGGCVRGVLPEFFAILRMWSATYFEDSPFFARGKFSGVGVCGWGLGPEIQAGRKTMNVERRPGGAYEILPGGARGPLVWRNRGGRRELTAHGRATLGNFQDMLLWVPVFEQ